MKLEFGRQLVGSQLCQRALLFLSLVFAAASAQSQDPPGRIDRGRFTVQFFPSEQRLAQSLADAAVRRDTFPGLPRPKARVLIMLAPDRERFREWIGSSAPEWGAAIAFPQASRIVMQGRSAGSDAGDPEGVLRHELAHLALYEYLGELTPRWFTEGYASLAAGEWGREELLAANLGLLFGGMPSFAELDEGFYGGAGKAGAAYALAHRAVAELAELDQRRGLTLFFEYWKETRSLDRAVRSAYGMTLSSFERRWQERTRFRYGGLALFADITVGSLAALVLLGPLYWTRRRRLRKRMAEMLVADEIAERAAAEAARNETINQL